MDAWVAAKGAQTMGYFKQADIPFHWALASAFTLCDAYHCSVLGPTNPNRLYMWTGMIDPNGTGGGPVIDDSPAYNNPYVNWTTYPERLTAAGITWRSTRSTTTTTTTRWPGASSTPRPTTTRVLWQSAMIKKPAGWFEDDALNDRLPQVSWLVAPSAQCEHPNWTAAAGAQYIASKIDAIAANPKVWAKTAFILMYDENDGYFDHVLPPTAPAGTADEYVDGVPIGLGFRVPCTIVSPWTVGGYVATETFDHTSLIRFLEQRFGIMEPNISAWRRQTVGDLTSAFQFSRTAPVPRRQPGAVSVRPPRSRCWPRRRRWRTTRRRRCRRSTPRRSRRRRTGRATCARARPPRNPTTVNIPNGPAWLPLAAPGRTAEELSRSCGAARTSRC